MPIRSLHGHIYVGAMHMFHLCDPAVTDVPMKSALEATNISHLVGTEATIYLLHRSAFSLFISVHNPGSGYFPG